MGILSNHYFILTPYSILLTVAAVASWLVARKVWKLRSAPGGKVLFWFLVLMGEWAITCALESAIIGIPNKIFWSQVSYIGVCSSAPLALLFAVRYTRHGEWVTRRNLILLWFIPVLTFLVAATNDWHHLLWSRITLYPDASRNLTIYEHGPWMWVLMGYSYLCLIGVVLLFTRQLTSSERTFRYQDIALLAAVFFPWLANLTYLAEYEPLRGLDLTPVAFIISGFVLFLAMDRFQLFDLIPVARHALVESMQDGVLVIDPQGRIGDVNPAARRLLGTNGRQIVGCSVHDVFSEIPNFLTYLEYPSDDQIKTRIGEYDLELQVSPLYFQRDKLSGQLVILHDITERKLTEDALEESRQKFLTFMEYLPAAIFMKDEESRIIYVNRFYEEFFGKARLDIPIQDIYPPEIAEGIIADDQKIFAEGKQERIEAVYDVKGQVHIFQTTKFPIFPESKSRLVAGFGLDITQNKKMEEEERSQRLLAEALRDTAATLNSTLDFDEVLDRILENVGRVLPYDLANIMLVDDKGWASVARAHGYAELGLETAVRQIHLSIKDTPTLAQMAQSGSWVIVQDTLEDEDWINLEGVDWMRSYLGAPIRVRGAVVGFINLDSLTPGFFNVDHADRLLIFTDQAAIAIDNARMFARMEQLAVTDALTGLNNRRHFFQLAEVEVDRAVRYSKPVSLIMIDIDHFKNVNDTYGHPVGDSVLQTVAQVCSHVIRRIDIIGRYGGEEFVVLLPETRYDCAFVVADRLRQAIAGIQVPSPAGVVQVTASLGVAELGESAGLDRLLDHADQALYQAKQSGRNRVLAYK